MRSHLHLVAGLTVVLWLVVPVAAQRGTMDGQWRSYNGDLGATKYAPLDQITESNVQTLRIAWRRPAVDPKLTSGKAPLKSSANFRATPLMVNGVLYSPNGVGLVEAFHPATGQTIWVQEPFSASELGGDSTRGVAYWSDGKEE